MKSGAVGGTALQNQKNLSESASLPRCFAESFLAMSARF
jgi:hypothetical protein